MRSTISGAVSPPRRSSGCNAGPVEQRAEDVLDGGVETVAREQRQPVVGIDLQLLGPAADVAEDVAVGLRHALRVAGGAGGVEDVGQGVGVRLPGRRGPPALPDTRLATPGPPLARAASRRLGHEISGRPVSREPGRGGEPWRVGDDGLRARILQHPLVARPRRRKGRAARRPYRPAARRAGRRSSVRRGRAAGRCGPAWQPRDGEDIGGDRLRAAIQFA